MTQTYYVSLQSVQPEVYELDLETLKYMSHLHADITSQYNDSDNHYDMSSKFKVVTPETFTFVLEYIDLIKKNEIKNVSPGPDCNRSINPKLFLSKNDYLFLCRILDGPEKTNEYVSSFEDKKRNLKRLERYLVVSHELGVTSLEDKLAAWYASILHTLKDMDELKEVLSML